MGQLYTSGKRSKAMCDRCGIEIKYQKLKAEWTGLKVCRDCWDPKTALEFPSNFPSDPEALRDPRPDNDKEASNGTVYIGTDDLGTTFTTPALELILGEVTVSIV